MSGDLFDITSEGDVVLRLHVQPGAGRTAAVGRHGDALKLKVAAPPTGGKANDACLAFVAELFGVKADQVELTQGQSSRTKRVKVTGIEADDARHLLATALDGTGNAGPAWNVRPPDH
ncbi:MAG TPA: DUF167 domain-containing protein [Acidimicrobiales bacterium]|nr:DUF167 domain-containing protein [Acidimicrobiales bacterium]